MNQREALQLALEALEVNLGTWSAKKKAIPAIKEVLAQPEQEPVATIAVRWHEPVGKVAFVLEVNLPVGIHKVYATSPQPEPVIDKSAAIRIDTALGWEPKRKPLTSQERDAQRWRFLMDNSYDSQSVTQFHVWEHSWEPHSKTGEPTEWKQRVRGIALIDFIDRAIEAKHQIFEDKK